MSREGFVLAGGLSRRMGCDKALIAWQGTTTLSDWNLIVACDMPLLDPSVLERMLDHVRVHADQNRREISEVFETLDICEWQVFGEMASNWNTPDDLAAPGSAPGQ